MISDPAPAVVDIAIVSWPSVRLAYGKYAIGTPPSMASRPAQNGRVTPPGTELHA